MPGETSIGRGGADNDSVLKHVINISLLFIILVFCRRIHLITDAIIFPILSLRQRSALVFIQFSLLLEFCVQLKN